MIGADFETASEAELKKIGATAYAQHPSTRAILLAWHMKGAKAVHLFRENEIMRPWRRVDPTLRWAVENEDVLWTAWNAAFERAIWRWVLTERFGWPDIPLRRWRCTMAQATYQGLPASLDEASNAIGLGVEKDKGGHALMLRMCRPRGFAEDGTARWWHLEDREKYDALAAYCVQDVRAEVAIRDALPALPADEADTWRIDQEINDRGVLIDRDLASSMERLAQDEMERLDAEAAKLTGGRVRKLTAVAKIGEYLRGPCGLDVDNLQRATIEDMLDEEPPDDPAGQRGFELLRLRGQYAKASTAKLQKMLETISPVSGRVHGLLQYYGASRTGRWAGRLIQPQNMPRGELPKGFDAAGLADLAACGMLTARDLAALIKQETGETVGPLSIISSLLRACIVPGDGKVMISGDLSQIEARVIAWLAGFYSKVEAFRRGEDLYCVAAGAIYRRPINAKDHPQERQIGKVAELACGFQGGVGAFQQMAATYRVVVGDAQAKQIVDAWRAGSQPIVALWYEMDDAFREAIASPGGFKRRVGAQSLWVWRQKGSPHVAIRLPSDRDLVYRDVAIKWMSRPGFSEKRPTCTFWGVDQKTRKWRLQTTYGGKLIENVTQATARDVMRDGMRWLDYHAPEVAAPIMTVHDEIVCEADEDQADKAASLVEEALTTGATGWSGDLPLAADVKIMARYRK